MEISEIDQMLLRRQQANPEAARLRQRLTELWHRQTRLEFLRDMDWLTQSQAADLTGVYRGEIHRAIENSKLETNGLTGHECRVKPASLWAFWSRREQRALARIVQRASG